MFLISYPFRLNGSGAVQTTEEGEDYYAEELACLIQTTPGERHLVPDYGIEDPTFYAINKSELIEKVRLFGPPVSIEDIVVVPVSDERTTVNVTYSATDVDDPLLNDDFISLDEMDNFTYNNNNDVALEGFYDATEGN